MALCTYKIFLEERFLRAGMLGQRCAHTYVIISLELKTNSGVSTSQNEKCGMRLVYCINDDFLVLIYTAVLQEVIIRGNWVKI